MPRDGGPTRDRLVEAAEVLLAARGVHQATTREITEAAGQRNVSALSYHFGSRTQLLAEILRRHGRPMDDGRAALVHEPIGDQSTRSLVMALLVPYTAALEQPSGRCYVRIVAQLTDQFPIWRQEGELSPPHLRRILGELETRCPVPHARARERLVAVIMLLTAAVAERARLIDEGVALTLDHEEFVDDLAAMIAGMIEAPVLSAAARS